MACSSICKLNFSNGLVMAFKFTCSMNPPLENQSSKIEENEDIDDLFEEYQHQHEH